MSSSPLRVTTVLADLGRLAGMQVVLALAGLARYKILAVRLGPDGLGAFQQLAVAAGTITVLVSFGLSSGLNRNVAAATTREQRQALLKSANGVVWGLTLTSWAVLAAILLVNPGAVGVLGVPLTSDTMLAGGVLALSIPIEATKNNFVGFLMGVQDVRGLTKGRSVAVLLATVLSLPMLWFFDLLGAALQLGCITLLVVVALGRACRKLRYSPFRAQIDRAAVVALTAFGAASLAAAFAQQFSNLLVRTQLVHHTSLAENGFYQAALVLVTQVQTVMLGSVGSQAVALLSVDTSRAYVSDTANSLLRGVLPVAVLALSAVGLLAVPLLIVLYSPSFTVAARFLPLLLGAVLLETFVWVIGAPLLAVRALRMWLIFELVYLACRVAASVALLPVMGAKAVAAGYFLAMCVHLATNAYAYFRVFHFELDPMHVRHVGIGLALVLATSWLGSVATPTWQHFSLGAALWMVYLAIMGRRYVGLERARSFLHRVRTAGAR